MAAVHPLEDTGVAENVACLSGSGGIGSGKANGAVTRVWTGRGHNEDGEMSESRDWWRVF